MEFTKYQYFVGHPFLIHGGYRGFEYNVRLHFYNGLTQAQSQTTDLVVNVHEFLFDQGRHLEVARSRSILKRKQQLNKNSDFKRRFPQKTTAETKQIVTKRQNVATTAAN